jgi:competence protein ComGC
MKKTNKKALTLMELTLFLLCSMILLMAISNTISNYNYALDRVTDNNNIIMIMDSISERIKYDINSGKSYEELDFDSYKEELETNLYKLIFRKEENNITILLGVYRNESFGNVNLPKIARVYKKEVRLNE